MPYARRGPARKKLYRRKAFNRKFSKFNLYKRRGAKAQASQIYSLNRKVNYVYKACKKPIHFADSITYSMDNITVNDTTSSTHPHMRSFRMLKSMFSQWNCRFDGDRTDGNMKSFNDYVSALDPGTEKFRLKNGVLNISMVKKSTEAETNEVVTGFDGVIGVDIYIFQYKQAFTSASGAIPALFGPEDQLRYDMTDIMQPLPSGIWQYIKVLKHKRVYLNDFQRDGKFFKLKFKPYYKTIKTSKMEASGTNTDAISHTINVAFRLFGESHDNGAKLDIDMNFRQYFTV